MTISNIMFRHTRRRSEDVELLASLTAVFGLDFRVEIPFQSTLFACMYVFQGAGGENRILHIRLLERQAVLAMSHSA